MEKTVCQEQKPVCVCQSDAGRATGYTIQQRRKSTVRYDYGHLIDDDSKEQNTLTEVDLHIGKSRRILHTV